MKCGYIKLGIFIIFVLFVFTETAIGEHVDNNKLVIKYPQKYLGDDIYKVIDRMKKLSKKVPKKDEFETTEEYKLRLKTIVDSNKMEKDIIFVFRPRMSEVTYDADEKTLSVSIRNYDYNDNYEAFILKDTRKITGSYISKNGFGTKVRVTKLDQSLIKLSHTYEYNRELGLEYDYHMNKINVITTPEMAKRIKSNIAVSYTASPVPHYYKLDIQKLGPSFRDPREVTQKKQILYVEFKKVAIYNYLSGEIYGEINISECVKSLRRRTNENGDIIFGRPILELEI